MIHQDSLVKILQELLIREYLQESSQNGIIFQAQKNLSRKYLIYLTDISCKKIKQMRRLLHESSKILALLKK